MLVYTCFRSPLGPIWLLGKEGRLSMVHFGGKEEFLKRAGLFGEVIEPSCQGLELALEELDLYFSGRLEEFRTPLEIKGTAFQVEVWFEVKRLKWGELSTYKVIAERSGHPGCARAVGQALKRNPLPLFIPCHRVISARGNLGGYSAGLGIKMWLLRHEGVL